MANLQKLKSNKFTTTEKTNLYLDNALFDELRDNMLASTGDLKLDTTYAFKMQEQMNGTESSQILIDHWHKVNETTDNYRGFYTADANTMLIQLKNSFNETDEDIADGLNTGEVIAPVSTTKTTVSNSSPFAGAISTINGICSKCAEYNQYAEYMTGDNEVDEEIIRLFNEYGDDLSGLYDDMDFSWENASETTKKALSRIYEVDIEYIDGHLSNKKCADYETRVETILMFVSNGIGANEPTIFNTQYLNEIKSYITSDTAKQYITELSTLQRNDYDYVPGLSELNIRIDGVGIIFEFEDSQNGDVTEVMCYTSEDRTRRCIEYWEKEDPGCFNHEYGLLMNGDSIDDAREKLIDMYNSAKTSSDIELLDKLFKSDGTYNDVFTVDPNGISGNAQCILGNHLLMLSSDKYKYADYKEYQNFVNSALSGPYASDYIDTFAVGCSMTTDLLSQTLLMDNMSDKEIEDTARQIEISSHNEMMFLAISTTLATYNDSLFKYHELSDMSIELTGNGTGEDSCNFESVDSFKFNYTVDTHVRDTYSPYSSATIRTESVILKVHDLKSYAGKDAICAAKMCELEEKKQEAFKDATIDALCDLTGVVSKPAGKALKMMVKAGKSTDAALQYGATTGLEALTEDTSIAEEAKAGIILCNAISGYYSKIQDYDNQKQSYVDIANAGMFYTVYTYETDKRTYYYCKITDANKIRAIKEWDEKGINALYDGVTIGDENITAEQYFDDTLHTADGDNVNYFGKVKNMCPNYSDIEIENATNALIHGCENNKNYNSIIEIPDDLRMACIIALGNEKSDEMEEIQGAFKDLEDSYGEASN